MIRHQPRSQGRSPFHSAKVGALMAWWHFKKSCVNLFTLSLLSKWLWLSVIKALNAIKLFYRCSQDLHSSGDTRSLLRRGFWGCHATHPSLHDRSEHDCGGDYALWGMKWVMVFKLNVMSTICPSIEQTWYLLLLSPFYSESLEPVQ